MIDLLASVPGVTPLWFAGLTVLAFFTAAFGIVAGLGGGVLMLGVMATVFPPAAVIPLHGAVQFGTNLTRNFIMWKRIAGEQIAAFGAGALIGGIVGGNLVVALPAAPLQIILGSFILYACWAPKWGHRPYSHRWFFTLGGLGALLSMFVGATGTVLAPFIAAANPDRRAYVATNSVLMTIVHGLKVVVFGFLGFAFGTYLPLILAMVGAAFFGNIFGQRVLERMPEKLFRRVFQIVLTGLAIRLLYAGIEKAGLI